jgi:hypothetical protein
MDLVPAASMYSTPRSFLIIYLQAIAHNLFYLQAVIHIKESGRFGKNVHTIKLFRT